MPHHYKVPAIRTYEEEWIEIKEEEKEEETRELISKETKEEETKEPSPDEEIVEEDGKRYRRVVTDRVTSIRPDIPLGHSYVCELLDDEETFLVKSSKPIRFAKETEKQVESIERLDTARERDVSLSKIDTSRVQNWFARGGR